MSPLHSCFSEIKQQVILFILDNASRKYTIFKFHMNTNYVLIKCRQPVDIQTNSVQMNTSLNYLSIHADDTQTTKKNHADLLKKGGHFEIQNGGHTC